MTRLPLPYPHQVVADWIAANDVHVLKDAQKPLITAFHDTNLVLFDNSVATRRAIAALSDLSTHELKDIGITSTDVAAARSGRVTLIELNEIRHSGWPY